MITASKPTYFSRRPFLGLLICQFAYLFPTALPAILDLNGWLCVLIVSTILAFGSFYLLPIVLGIPSGRQPFSQYCRQIRLCSLHPLGRNFILGVLTASLLLASLYLASVITGTFAKFEFTRIDSLHLSHSLLHGFWEEVFFRGIALVLLMYLLSSRQRILLANALIFSMSHIYNVENWIIFFLFGLVWVYMVFKSGSLLAAIISHSLYDFLAITIQPSIQVNDYYRWLIAWFGFALLATLACLWLVNRLIDRNSPKGHSITGASRI